MKKTLSYLLFFIYLLTMLKPVLPYITDFLSHTFWYAQHVATIHYEQGKYHVHLQINEQEKKNKTEKKSSPPTKNLFGSEHVLQAINDMPFYFIEKKTYFALVQLLFINPFKYNNYPPPKASAV